METQNHNELINLSEVNVNFFGVGGYSIFEELTETPKNNGDK